MLLRMYIWVGRELIVFKMCYCDSIKGLYTEGILIDINLLCLENLLFMPFMIVANQKMGSSLVELFRLFNEFTRNLRVI